MNLPWYQEAQVGHCHILTCAEMVLGSVAVGWCGNLLLVGVGGTVHRQWPPMVLVLE